MSKVWREAASIIIAARANIVKQGTNVAKNTLNAEDYKILVLKRGKTSNFFPGGYVFPGGAIETADSSEDWLDHFANHGVKFEELQNLDSTSSTHPSIFNEKVDSKVPRSVSLRITAIRETFEESGILLCKTDNNISPWASFLKDFEIKKWQGAVQKSASEFLNLCKTLKCVPDVKALHQWSNWLTPTSNPIRFDTAFFLATVDQPPPSFMNEGEMDDITWETPTELTKEGTETRWLPPPQYYEMSRLRQFSSIDKLTSHAAERANHGCVRWMPVMKKADDGIITYFPGDEEYPDNIDIYTKTSIERIKGTMESLRKPRQSNRAELYGERGIRLLVSNIETWCGHVLPLLSKL